MSDSAPAPARLFSPPRVRRPEPAPGARFSRGRASIRFGRAEDCFFTTFGNAGSSVSGRTPFRRDFSATLSRAASLREPRRARPSAA